MKKYFILFAMSAIVFAACESPKSTTSPTEQAAAQTYEFTINAVGNTMTDMAYDTKEIKVSAGAIVKVNLVNTGTDETMLHNIVFVKAGSEKEVAMEGINMKEHDYFNSSNANVIAGSAITTPGTSASVEFTAPEAGTYSYICTYPGHWQAMRGTLIVE